MKLGVSYNVFDGEELLGPSIRLIREQVDYISVVYQVKSNYNNPCSDYLLDHLIQLKSIGLIDEFLEYTPKIFSLKYMPKIFSRDSNKGSYNELEKRNIGLNLSRINGCNHHMNMDCDEFYVPEQFLHMKKVIIEHGCELGICHFQNYYKDSIYLIKSPPNNFVPTIFKILDNTEFIYRLKGFPVRVDPTRRTNNKNPIIFDQSEVQMHHMSLVRENLRAKFTNSSYQKHGVKAIEKSIRYYDCWEYPKPAMDMMGGMHSVIEVKRIFDRILSLCKPER